MYYIVFLKLAEEICTFHLIILDDLENIIRWLVYFNAIYLYTHTYISCMVMTLQEPTNFVYVMVRGIYFREIFAHLFDVTLVAKCVCVWVRVFLQNPSI